MIWARMCKRQGSHENMAVHERPAMWHGGGATSGLGTMAVCQV